MRELKYVCFTDTNIIDILLMRKLKYVYLTITDIIRLYHTKDVPDAILENKHLLKLIYKTMNNQQYEVFRTPQWVIDLLIDSDYFYDIIRNNYHCGVASCNILDPSAGDNRIIKSIENYIKKENDKQLFLVEKYAIDVLPNINLTPEFNGVDYDIAHEKLKATNTKFDLVITNPPFTKAEPWIKKMHEVITDGGYCIFLQRLNWLGTKKRSEYLKNNKDLRLKHLLVISKRPTWEIDGVEKNKTDTCEYAWFVFQKGFDGMYNGDWLI